MTAPSQPPKSLAREAAEKILKRDVESDDYLQQETVEQIIATLIDPVVKELHWARIEVEPTFGKPTKEAIKCLEHITRALRMLKGEG